MCDEAKLAQWAKQGLNRRQFGILGGVAAIGACAPMAGGSGGDASLPALTERQVSFETSAGTMDGFFVAPASGPAPGVLFWPDIAGLREAKRAMARRLAGRGFAVLVVNPYSRDVAGERFVVPCQLRVQKEPALSEVGRLRRVEAGRAQRVDALRRVRRVGEPAERVHLALHVLRLDEQEGEQRAVARAVAPGLGIFRL